MDIVKKDGNEGIFISKEEAADIWKALTKKPIELDTEEEIASVKATVQLLKKTLSAIESEPELGNDNAKGENDK